MFGAGAISTITPSVWLFSSTNSSNCSSAPRISFPSSRHPFSYSHHFSSHQTTTRRQTHFFVKATSPLPSADSAEYVEESATKAIFQTSLILPGCSSSLTLFGTGYREKVFAIIGVKVYAAALYLDQAIVSHLKAWKGQSADGIKRNHSLFKSIFQSPSEKSLQIILVRDVDGKTFWDALDDAISPRIKAPSPVDEIALSKFRSVFQNRPLKKGTFIFLTWVDGSKLLVSVSSQGIPSTVDATIESVNVTSALFDVFLGDSPVSPTLKASVSEGLSKMLK